jgi:bifunctional DNA-binding transcriptional regulator/antitoxin component of YhaV-PrlF toxin-antitoxin module
MQSSIIGPNSHITICEEDENGSLILEIPDQLLESQGWKEGTVLDITAENGTILLREVSPSENLIVVNGD